MRILKWALLLMAAVLLWGLIYWNLATFGRWFTYSLLNMPQGGHLSSAVEFFVFETPKVLMLLVLIVFGIGIVRSFFTPEKTRKILSGKSEAVGNILAAFSVLLRLFVRVRLCLCSSAL